MCALTLRLLLCAPDRSHAMRSLELGLGAGKCWVALHTNTAYKYHTMDAFASVRVSPFVGVWPLTLSCLCPRSGVSDDLLGDIARACTSLQEVRLTLAQISDEGASLCRSASLNAFSTLHSLILALTSLRPKAPHTELPQTARPAPLALRRTFHRACAEWSVRQW